MMLKKNDEVSHRRPHTLLSGRQVRARLRGGGEGEKISDVRASKKESFVTSLGAACLQRARMSVRGQLEGHATARHRRS